MAEKTNDADRPDRPDVPRNEFEALHAFQGVMWEKLHANQHKGGWQEDLPARLLERLRGELKELETALIEYCVLDLTLKDEKSEELRRAAEHVTKEAADVANFAMMIADNVGGLAYKRVG